MTQVAAGAREALGSAADALEAAGIESPRLDAEVLLAAASGTDRAALLAGDVDVSPAAARLFGEMVRRRLRREPVAYILGRKWFRRIELAVDPRVLIPRPESELLVELALELEPRAVLDVGTGSGAIALAVADELPGCRVVATDTSAAALAVARANAERLGLGDRVELVEGTLPPACGGFYAHADQKPPHRSRFDLVVANLPYVAEADWPSLQPEVTRWEPREALLAGPDGLDAYRSLIPSLIDSCRSSPRIAVSSATSTGVVALEVGEGQADAVASMLGDAGFAEVETRRDLAGIERVVVGKVNGG